MGQLANAAALMQDPEWREWLVASAAYQARVVVTEDPATPDHAVRYRLAQDAIVSPSMLADRLVSVVSTDPDIAALGGTPALVGETLPIQKTAAVWTALAKLLYPEG
jgi:hypothetical protein